MGTNWETGTNTHALQCIKLRTSEKLLCSTGTSTQCSAVTSVGSKSKEEEIDIHMADSLCYTAETDTAA